MRRIALTLVLLIAVTAFALTGVAGGQDGSGDDDGSYRVRAIFDNGGFIVKDEDVRIGGATIGKVESVDVTRKDEIVSLEGGPHAVPGKAVVILDITDPGFHAFRADASCLIRPQSLIGEKFVECEPTQPRAPGSEPPPRTEQIEDGEAGEGQYLLPLENNGKAIDIDLLNNIMKEPYADRFRLILNNLGATFAARGDDLDQIVRKANPALRETDEVLKVLADQNDELAQLNLDSDAVLTAIAREKDSLSGFLRTSGETAAATAERRGDLEQNLALLPPTLRELDSTMRQIGSFSEATQPVLEVLGGAAPAIAQATRQLGPFSDATTVSLKSLGDATETAGPDLRAADPVVRQLRDLGLAGTRPATNLGRLTGSLRETGGFDNLLKFIFNTAGTVNGFDRFGHYQRINILISTCIEYAVGLLPGCGANFIDEARSGRQDTLQDFLRLGAQSSRKSGGSQALPSADDGATTGIGRFTPAPLDELKPETTPGTPATPEPERSGSVAESDALDYLLGP